MAPNVKSAANATAPAGLGHRGGSAKEDGRFAGHAASDKRADPTKRQRATNDEIDAALNDIVNRRADLLRRLADA